MYSNTQLNDDEEAEAEVWKAVSRLERRFYTRDEIAEGLRAVAAQVENDA